MSANTRDIPRKSQAFPKADGRHTILFKVRGTGLAVYFPCLPAVPHLAYNEGTDKEWYSMMRMLSIWLERIVLFGQMIGFGCSDPLHKPSCYVPYVDDGH